MTVKSSKSNKARIKVPSSTPAPSAASHTGLSQAAFYEQMGAQIASARRAAGLTQEALAAKIGQKRASITHVEGGTQKPLPHALYLIADILNVNVEQLFPPSIASRRDLRATLDSLDPDVREKLERHIPPAKLTGS